MELVEQLSTSERCQAALALSEAMLEASRHEEWDALTAFEAKRRELMSHIFAVAAEPSEILDRTEFIRRLLDLDQQIISRCESGLRAAAAGLQEFQHSRGAQKAYHDVLTGEVGAS